MNPIYDQMHEFRRKLAAGTFCVGAGITIYDPSVVEALAPSVDFFWIDLEHGPISLESLQSQLIAARAGGAPALVRVPTSDVAWIKRVLDTGTAGIIIPQVRSAEEARRAVSACRYPPTGDRGFGPRRPSNYGRDGGQAFLDRANAGVFVTVQIETQGALAEIDQIVKLPGLDSVVIGPYDLSGSMGRLGDVTHPDVLAAISKIISAAHAAGKFVGMGMPGNAEQAQAAARMGVNWVQCGNDFSYMLSTVERLFADARKR
jgi:2-keto-3-deoxy-L-rhamnonate aldolase RhmA